MAQGGKGKGEGILFFINNILRKSHTPEGEHQAESLWADPERDHSMTGDDTAIVSQNIRVEREIKNYFLNENGRIKRQKVLFPHFSKEETEVQSQEEMPNFTLEYPLSRTGIQIPLVLKIVFIGSQTQRFRARRDFRGHGA